MKLLVIVSLLVLDFSSLGAFAMGEKRPAFEPSYTVKVIPYSSVQWVSTRERDMKQIIDAGIHMDACFQSMLKVPEKYLDGLGRVDDFKRGLSEELGGATITFQGVLESQQQSGSLRYDHEKNFFVYYIREYSLCTTVTALNQIGRVKGVPVHATACVSIGKSYLDDNHRQIDFVEPCAADEEKVLSVLQQAKVDLDNQVAALRQL